MMSFALFVLAAAYFIVADVLALRKTDKRAFAASAVIFAAAFALWGVRSFMR